MLESTVFTALLEIDISKLCLRKEHSVIMYTLFNSLPPELKFEITSHLDSASLCCLREVLLCKVSTDTLSLEETSAVIKHRIHFIEYFLQKALITQEILGEALMVEGDLYKIKWAYANRYLSRYDVFDTYAVIAISNGHLHILEWIKENARLGLLRAQIPMTHAAVQHNQVHILTWLKDNNYLYEDKLNIAHTLKVLQWIEENLPNWRAMSPVLTKYVISKGHLKTFQWIVQKNWMQPHSAWLYAVRESNFTVLEYLLTTNYNMPDISWAYACKGGSNMLRWLFAHNARFKQPTGGIKDIETLELALTHGMFIDINLVYCTANDGYLEVLKKLIELAPRFIHDKTLVYMAAYSNQFEVLKWLYHQSGSRFSKRAASIIVNHGDVEIIQWAFHIKLCMTSGVLTQAIKLEYKDKLIFWMIDHHAPISQSVFLEAAKYGRLEVLKYLLQHAEWKLPQKRVFNKFPKHIQEYLSTI